MIHIVTEDNRGLYVGEFARLAELVGEHPVRRAALASDARSTHLLALDDAGAPEFIGRFRPTDAGCAIAERAPGLIAAGAETIIGPKIWERTRIYAAPGLCGPEPAARRRSGELRLAVLEEARDQGVERIVEATPVARLVDALRSGWNVRLLGLPGDLDGEAVVALDVDASAEAAADLRERLADGPSRRLRLKAGDTPWAAAPKEIETFLEAAQQLDSSKLQPLLVALRAAVADDDET